MTAETLYLAAKRPAALEEIDDAIAFPAPVTDDKQPGHRSLAPLDQLRDHRLSRRQVEGLGCRDQE